MAGHLKNKVAIITGSNSGIGEAIAVCFASHGAKVTLHGRDQGRLMAVFNKVVEASGGQTDRFLTVSGDINDQGVRKQIVDQTVQKFGQLDILVANAGVVCKNQSVVGATEDDYDNIMNTNVKSVFFLVQQAVPHLEASKGNIIMMSSFISTVITPNFGIYTLSKAALDNLTRCFAVELGSRGIRVNSVNPGAIVTRFSRDYDEETVKATLNIERELQALNGQALTVADVAEAVVFLTSPSASFITGQNLAVDAGRSFYGPISVASLKREPSH